MSFTTSSRIQVLGSNRTALNRYSSFLQAEGYDVETSAVSHEIVQEIEQWSPAVIIIDLLANKQVEQQAWLLMQEIEVSHSASDVKFLICTVSFVIGVPTFSPIKIPAKQKKK